MSGDINLILDNNCGGVLRALYGVIKSPNYPFPYPDYLDCVCIIILERDSDIRIKFLAFDLPPAIEPCTNFVEIKEYGYSSHIYYGGSSIPSDFTWESGRVFVVEFRTGQNINRSYGFLLKYRIDEYSKFSITAKESAKVANLNAKGVYVQYIILIIPCKKEQNSLHFKNMLMKNFTESCGFIHNG